VACRQYRHVKAGRASSDDAQGSSERDCVINLRKQQAVVQCFASGIRRLIVVVGKKKELVRSGSVQIWASEVVVQC
jgi:hypothetical protein